MYPETKYRYNFAQKIKEIGRGILSLILVALFVAVFIWLVYTFLKIFGVI